MVALIIHKQSGFVVQDAFITSENAIPGAKLAEYAKVRRSVSCPPPVTLVGLSNSGMNP